MWSPSQAAAMRAAKRRPSVYPDINLTPLLAVSFVLLFIFMCIAPPYRAEGTGLDRPTAQSATLQPGAIREDAIRIAVSRDGRLYFATTEVVSAELPTLMRTALHDGAEKKVYLLVDSRARNGEVEIVIDQIRVAGIGNVAILANKFAARTGYERRL